MIHDIIFRWDRPHIDLFTCLNHKFEDVDFPHSILLSQFKESQIHQGLDNLHHMHAWLLSGIPTERETFLKEQPSVSQD